jgi:hypothetical protein
MRLHELAVETSGPAGATSRPSRCHTHRCPHVERMTTSRDLVNTDCQWWVRA